MANATFKKGLILFVLTLVFSFSTCAQKKGKLKEFSKEFPAYIEELNAFMTASDNADLKAIFKSFSKISWPEYSILEFNYFFCHLAKVTFKSY